MVNRSPLNQNVQKLTHEMGIEILKGMFSLCDRRAELFTRCEASGFSAFAPRNEFEESFCKCPTDASIHERAERESAKQSLTNSAIILPAPAGQIKRRYSSPFIEELKQQRDETNGCSESEITKNFPSDQHFIRRQYDPCLRAKAIEQQQNESDYQKKWQMVIDRQWEYFEHEARDHSSGLGNSWEVSADDRSAFVVEVAQKYGAELGFSAGKAKRAKRKPAICKVLSQDWNLWWIVSDTSTFAYSPFIRRSNRNEQSVLESHLLLCSSHLRGDILKNAKPGDYLPITYKLAVPAFIVAYRTFYDYDELELIVKADFLLLSLVLPTIENAIAETLLAQLSA